MADEVPVFDSRGDVPLKVKEIKINGLSRTSQDFIRAELEPILAGRNFGEILNACAECQDELKALDIFEDASLTLNRCSHPQSASLVVDAKEKSRIGTTINGSVGTNDASLDGDVWIRNLFGQAIKLTCGGSTGWNASRKLHASLLFPRVGPYRLHEMNMALFYDLINNRRHGNFDVLTRGFNVVLARRQQNHQLEYECNYRDIIPQVLASDEVHFLKDAEASCSLKSSLKYSFLYANVDSMNVPTQGSLVKASSEFAGIGGDVRFLKNELSIKHFLPFFLASQQLSLALSLRCGIINPWGSDKYTHIADRFFLGGPSSVRGFASKRMGPSTQGYATGGDVYYAGGITVSYPLVQDLGLRCQMFANYGNLLQIWGSPSHEKHIERAELTKQLYSQMRFSVGAGVVMPFLNTRIECNIVHAIAKQSGDGISRFQLGVGMDVL